MKIFFIKHWEALCLITIIAVGALLRLYQITSFPPGLYPDEAMNAIDAINNLRTGHFSVFYPANNGREGLFINILTLIFKYFGVSVLNFRLISPVIGIVTIFGIYLFAKEFFRFVSHPQEQPTWFPKAVAILSALFLATSFWHLNFSRIAFRAIFLPAVVCFGTYFTLRMLRKNSLLDALFAGAVWALGLYTYIPARTALAIPAFLIGAKIVQIFFLEKTERNRALQGKFVVSVFVFLVSSVAVVLPLALHFLHAPADFISRASGISVFADPHPIPTFAKSLGAHLQMFFFRGDGNWRQNISGWPELLPPIAILFLLGIIIFVKEWFGAWKYRDWQKLIGVGMLFVWFGALILPAALTNEGIPHALRSIGVVPLAQFFAAVGLVSIFAVLQKSRARLKHDLVVVLILLCAALPFYAYYQYFYIWGKNPNTPGAFASYYVSVGNFLNTLPDSTNKIVLVNQDAVLVPLAPELASLTNASLQIPVSSATTLFIQQTKNIPPLNTTYFGPKDFTEIDVRPGSIIVPFIPDEWMQEAITTSLPGKAHQTSDGVWYYTVAH